jgi:hypothetical protein
MRAAVILAAAILAGCATVPEPKRELPLRPAAFDDQPRALSAREEQVCRMAKIRQQQGLVRDIRSICRKAEWNFWGVDIPTAMGASALQLVVQQGWRP